MAKELIIVAIRLNAADFLTEMNDRMKLGFKSNIIANAGIILGDKLDEYYRNNRQGATDIANKISEAIEALKEKSGKK